MNIKQLLRKIRDQPFVITPAILLLRLLKKAGVSPAKSIYQHFPFRGVMQVAVSDYCNFKTISTGNEIENGLYWEGINSHEKGSMQIWIYLSKQSSVVLDIGANTGLYSLVSWALGSRIVHSFEPVKRIYDRLIQNFEANGDAIPTAWNMAISDQKGVIEIYDPGGECPYSASLSKQFMDAHFYGYTATKVKVIDIDQFCKDECLANVDLIKLDIEGHELNALNGMSMTLSKFAPWVLLEVIDDYEKELRNYFEINFSGSYRWFRINETDGSPNRNVLMIPRSRSPMGLPTYLQKYLIET